jgi:hypothetical protein
MERSRMLGEGETTRLYLRYSKEADSTFLRYFKELTATLKRDAEAGVETVATDTTATADPGAGAEADSRNEANDGATVTTAPTLSPWERVPEGRVRAAAIASAEASPQVPEGRVRASATASAEASPQVPEGPVKASAPPGAPALGPGSSNGGLLLALLVLLVGQILGGAGRSVVPPRLEAAVLRTEAWGTADLRSPPRRGQETRAEQGRGQTRAEQDSAPATPIRLPWIVPARPEDAGVSGG